MFFKKKVKLCMDCKYCAPAESKNYETGGKESYQGATCTNPATLRTSEEVESVPFVWKGKPVIKSWQSFCDTARMDKCGKRAKYFEPKEAV